MARRQSPAKERMITMLDNLGNAFTQSDYITKEYFEIMCDDCGLTMNQRRAFFDEHRLLHWLDDERLGRSADLYIFIEGEKERYEQYLKERKEI